MRQLRYPSDMADAEMDPDRAPVASACPSDSLRRSPWDPSPAGDRGWHPPSGW